MENKKISFGFSKQSKKPTVKLADISKDENDIQYIDSIEDRKVKLANNSKEEKKPTSLIIPLKTDSNVEAESTIDYNDVPVSEFGLAMLRGMGWEPGKGIGKKQEVAVVHTPNLRPKGMGLGAEKFFTDKSTNKEILKKGSFVKFRSGDGKTTCGQVEGFCDESGRVIVRTLDKSTITMNEFMLTMVSKEEFNDSNGIGYKKYDSHKYRKGDKR